MRIWHSKNGAQPAQGCSGKYATDAAPARQSTGRARPPVALTFILGKTVSVTSEEIRAIIVSEWPRLYLDTGDLLAIADGKADADVVDRLIATCGERGVLLVVSRAHFQDVAAVDQATRDRVSDVLERFRWRTVVMQGPEDLEALATEAVDIGLALAPNIRDLNDHSVTAVSMQRQLAFQQEVFEAFAASQQARVRAGRSPSQRAKTLGVMCLISLVHGSPQGDLATIFEIHKREHGFDVEAWEQEAILAEIEPMAKFLASVQDMPDLPEDWRLLALLHLKAGANTRFETLAPGQYLSTRLNGGFVQNVGRRPLKSDVVDIAHVSHLPYVDVATCDRAAFAMINQHLSRVSCPRQVKLFRNGSWSEVLEAVEGLPNANQAMVERMSASTVLE